MCNKPLRLTAFFVPVNAPLGNEQKVKEEEATWWDCHQIDAVFSTTTVSDTMMVQAGTWGVLSCLAKGGKDQRWVS